jgi:hypothetical protein
MDGSCGKHAQLAITDGEEVYLALFQGVRKIERAVLE